MLVETMNQIIYSLVIHMFKRLSDSDSRRVPSAEPDAAFLVPPSLQKYTL